MLHFVIKDAEPTVLSNPEKIIKLFNDMVMLISAANGPALFEDLLKIENDRAILEAQENDFHAKFDGGISDQYIQSGKFRLLEDGALVFEALFTINDETPTDVRVKLNCEGETLVRQELERELERDFSFEAEQYMVGRNELNDETAKVTAGLNDKVSESDSNDDVPKVQISSSDDITEVDLNELPFELEEDLYEPQIMLARLNGVVHDIFRGAIGDFSNESIGSETIENGAKIKFMDYTHESFLVTFRHGTLDQAVEVSFFLEEEEELIFSAHFSSDGYGRLSGSDSRLLERIKRSLLSV